MMKFDQGPVFNSLWSIIHIWLVLLGIYMFLNFFIITPCSLSLLTWFHLRCTIIFYPFATLSNFGYSVRRYELVHCFAKEVR